MSIAGHFFTDTQTGRCSCGKRFADIAIATEGDIGSSGIAHQGDLNKSEYDQIVAEKDRIWALVSGVASGRGVPMPEPAVDWDQLVSTPD